MELIFSCYMKAVFLAAGKGTRMRPLTDNRPKSLLPVGNKPMITYLLDKCLSAGLDEAVIVSNHLGSQLKDFLGDSFNGLNISFVEQPEARGTGDAVYAARSKVEGEFLVVNGDLFMEEDIFRKMVELEGNALAVKEVEDASSYGSVVVKDRLVEEVLEKRDEPPSNLVNAGIYRFNSNIFDALEDVQVSERGEIELTDAVNNLESVSPVKLEGFWLDVGYPWDLLEANEQALRFIDRSIQGNVEKGAVVKGPVSIGKGTTVKSGSYIEGPVMIGRNCEVGPNCYIRAATSLGNNVRVGSSVEVKNSLIMEGVNASHLSYIGDTVVGKETNIGAGTMAANLRHDEKNIEVEVKGELVDSGRKKLGSIIGEKSKTGVNTSLNPGTVLKTGSKTSPGTSL